MTTILVTEDFVLADRRVIAMSLDTVTHASESKIWVDPKGRGALGIAGSRETALDDVTFSRLFEAAFKATESMAEHDIAEFKRLSDEVFRNLYAAYLVTRKGSFFVNGYITVVNHPHTKETGSGGLFARAAYYYGVKPEEIVPLVANFDETTSPEYDIFYRKDLK